LAKPASRHQTSDLLAAMASITSPANLIAHSEHHVVHTVHATLRLLFGLVPIVAGLDKFTNFLVDWVAYLNPLMTRIFPLSDVTFMHVVGVIEIVAGVLVFAKPRAGGYLVMAWLLAIAAQLILWNHHLDVAVRDITLALGGALTLARLTPFAEHRAGYGT
jgi:uncharacterized membrane protein YphA (DoxX/SURF4 family)